MHPLIAAMRRLLESPKVNTYAVLQLAIRISQQDVDLWNQLGIWNDGEWIV
jgi:hypothetical protein